MPRVKGYLEYVELYAYFARTGERKLTREDFESAHAEWKALSVRLTELSKLERERLSELKSMLYRDRP